MNRSLGKKHPQIWPVIAAMLITILLLPGSSWAFEQYTRVIKYDKYFSKYSKRFFGPGFDWHYFKSQAIAESHLKADAKSRVGAVGIMQIMPSTYQEILHKNPIIKGTRAQPRWNIAAGIFYDRTIWNLWIAERPLQDRLNFMFGSYNAGKGSILKAQKIARRKGLNENLWESIEVTLYQVTGNRSKETIGYVRKIGKIKEVLR
jgi:membrane-bound lytic murein transglycosylase F